MNPRASTGCVNQILNICYVMDLRHSVPAIFGPVMRMPGEYQSVSGPGPVVPGTTV